MMRNCLLLILPFLLFAACSRVPIAANHEMSFQKKAKSAHHWNVLADDVSRQVFQAMSSNQISVKNRFSIAPPGNSTSFSKAFNNFLINGLVNRGLTVTKEKHDTTVLAFENQLIRHNSNRYTHIPGSLTLIANGLWVLRDAASYAQFAIPAMGADLAATFYAGPQTHIELVVTSSIYEKDRYVFRRSDIYYIESEDTDLFREYMDLNTKSVEVTDK